MFRGFEDAEEEENCGRRPCEDGLVKAGREIGILRVPGRVHVPEDPAAKVHLKTWIHVKSVAAAVPL